VETYVAPDDPLIERASLMDWVRFAVLRDANLKGDVPETPGSFDTPDPPESLDPPAAGGRANGWVCFAVFVNWSSEAPHGLGRFRNRVGEARLASFCAFRVFSSTGTFWNVVERGIGFVPQIRARKLRLFRLISIGPTLIVVMHHLPITGGAARRVLYKDSTLHFWRRNAEDFLIFTMAGAARSDVN
jgi:hypothetical protein